MANQPDKHLRSVLPIPSRGSAGLVKYDAKDPEAKFPPIEPLRPPAGAPNVLVVLLDDAGFGSASAFGGPCYTPNFERLAANGLRYNRFHTTALCAPTRQALLTGRNHHTVGMGTITELATAAPGYTSIRPDTCAPLAETLKLNGYSTAQFGKCHEVPVWETSPLGPFNAWPTGGGGFEYFYGFHRRRDQPVLPGDLRRHHGAGAAQDARRRLSLHRRHDRQGHQLGAAAKGADARQALLRLLRAGRDACAASRAEGMVRQVQGQVRSGLGQAARRDFCAAEGAGRDSARCRIDRAPAGDSRVGRCRPGAQARAGAPDGGVCRVHGAHRPSRRAAVGFAGRPRHSGRHADLCHHRRQRRQRRRHAERHLQRDADVERRVRAGDGRVHGLEDRPVRRPQLLQSLCGGLGARHGHAVSVDQAGRFALGRHAQRHHRPLAQRYRTPRASCARSSIT